MEAYYKPDVFEVNNEHEAKRIILTPEGSTTNQRWQQETPYLANDIGQFLALDERSLVLDFGCGIGRISKALVEQYSCRALGVDISRSMRELSLKYVDNELFSISSKPLLAKLVENGLRFDACVAIWVLQHCMNVEQEVDFIKAALKKNGSLYILNNHYSAIPTDQGWVNDGSNIKQILEKNFELVSYSRLPSECAPQGLVNNTFIGKFRLGE